MLCVLSLFVKYLVGIFNSSPVLYPTSYRLQADTSVPTWYAVHLSFWVIVVNNCIVLFDYFFVPTT